MIHPEHHAFDRTIAGLFPSKPLKGSWYLQWQRERACHRNGGHWWHPERDGMIDWFCCQCGKETEGMPEDGSSR